MEENKKNFRLDLISFVLGIASVFLWNLFSLIPVLAAILGFCSIVKYAKDKQQKLWQAVIGSALGLIYIVVAIYGSIISSYY